MEIDWENPIVKQVATTGANLFLDWWNWFFRNRRTTLAFTGMQGVGKSVLFDYLTGRGFLPDYQPPFTTQHRESGDLEIGNNRILCEIVPGQAMTHHRFKALNEVFSRTRPIVGVIHVVAYGHATVGSENDRTNLILGEGIDNIEKFREYQRNREIEDLKETCHYILESHREARCPTWLLVAIDKIDLFPSALTQAKDYYSPYSTSEFARVLNDLSQKVGTTFFRWETVPICTHLENLTWNQGAVISRVSVDKRNAYVNQFQRLLESYFPQE